MAGVFSSGLRHTIQTQAINLVFLDEPADPIVQRGHDRRTIGVDVDKRDLYH